MLMFVLALAMAQAPAPLFADRFGAPVEGEAVATLTASCERCDWEVEGREAATVRVTIDGRYSQHVVLTRGEKPSQYRISLGHVTAGSHKMEVTLDARLSAKNIGRVTVPSVSVNVTAAWDEPGLAQSMAPFIYARPDTVGKFTDVPVLMWYEIVPVPQGRQFRYSVIFTNEDGGTSTDRLMATWGRTTDIEYIYGATLDAQGRLVAEEFQGPNHEVPAFRGRHEAAHPLQWVSTDNNMVSESGPTDIRFAPAPEKVDLTNRSREVVMDTHPWIHELASKEMVREKKLNDDAVAGSGAIPDPRRFVFVEACTELQNAAVAFAVHARDASGEVRWFDSDRGLPQFRIVRSGCFRGAVPLPRGTAEPDAVRFKAFTLPPKKDAPPASGPVSVVLTRVNRVFMLDPSYLPGASIFEWNGTAPLAIDGPAVEMTIQKKSP